MDVPKPFVRPKIADAAGSHLARGGEQKAKRTTRDRV